MPVVARPRSINRRSPTLVQPVAASRAKSIAAEMKGPPSLPCWRWTGSLVRSTSEPVSTICCTGASSRPTSMNSGLRRSRRRISGNSFCGGTPKACANRVRPASALPTNACPPADSNSTAFGLASSARAISVSLVTPTRRSSSLSSSPSTKDFSRKLSKSTAGTMDKAGEGAICINPSSPVRPWRAAARRSPGTRSYRPRPRSRARASTAP